MKNLSILLLLAVPCSALAQDFHKGGFFDTDVSQSGFFTDDQAGIPIKNNTGTTTTRVKNDTWEVAPDKVAGVGTPQVDVVSNDQAPKDQASNADSFEVKKAPTD